MPDTSWHQHVQTLCAALLPSAEALRGATSREQVVETIRGKAAELASDLVDGETGPLVEASLDEVFGLGPLEPLLRDTAVQTIRLHGHELTAVRSTGDEPAERSFRDNAHARAFVDRILTSVGESLGDGSEEVVATMMDGSTVRARGGGDGLHVVISRA